jgi:hypothetical protein
MRRGSKSSWKGEHWIVVQDKEESEERKSRDKRIVMMTLIIQE